MSLWRVSCTHLNDRASVVRFITSHPLSAHFEHDAALRNVKLNTELVSADCGKVKDDGRVWDAQPVWAVMCYITFSSARGN